MKYLLYIFSTVLIFLSLSVSAQTLDEAKALFAAGKYSEAETAFDALLKKTPNDATVPYYYGVTCYKLNDLENAEKYLKAAADKKNLEAYAYLGDLYFDAYRFREASDSYQKYLPFIKNNSKLTAVYEEKIKKADMGNQMLQRVEQVEIVDSIIVDKNNFLSAYKLSKESGQLFSYNDFFETDTNIDAAVFKTERGNQILYAEKNKHSGFDLYSQDKLLNDYGNKKNLSNVLNSEYDENYPFMLNDGVTLYYASNNPEISLGGYDIFVTRYNLANDAYLTPENKGMPFNSPYNDYMMAIDELNEIGWFASDRYQPEDKLIIYIFIPYQEKIIIRNHPESYLRKMAKITDIKSTQNSDKNYTRLLNQIDNQPKVEKQTGDFYFIVADNLIYTRLSDFQSSEAKTYFTKAREAEKQLNDKQTLLDAKRLEYGLATTPKRAVLNDDILELEKEVQSLLNQPNDLYLKTRNEEIRYLMKK